MSLTFFTDFFNTTIMNHCEFLKTLMTLDKDDSTLMVALLEKMSSSNNNNNNGGGGDQMNQPEWFYDNHRSYPKNPINILRTYKALKSLKGHEFNIYEYSFMDSSKLSIAILAIVTFIMQVGLVAVLIYWNASGKITTVGIIWVINVATTLFFCRQAYKQWQGTVEFIKCFRVLQNTSCISPMFLMNSIANMGLAIVIPIFNFYYLLLHDDPNDAILNSLALLFILEIDTMVLPDWDENRVLDELAINAHDYIMEDEEDDFVKVSKEQKVMNYKDDDKLYIKLNRRNCQIVIFKRIDSLMYESCTYSVSGIGKDEFMELCFEFECIMNYYDIHD